MNNFSGVVLWENADRFCNSPANSSGGTCTLVNPAVTLSTCVAGTINSAPYYSDCRWKTQNVSVTGNTFTLSPGSIPNCTTANSDAASTGFSRTGERTRAGRRTRADVIEQAITFNQNNVFSNNTYTGPWQFMAHDQGTTLTSSQWKATPYNQDAGSTFTN